MLSTDPQRGRRKRVRMNGTPHKLSPLDPNFALTGGGGSPPTGTQLKNSSAQSFYSRLPKKRPAGIAKRTQ